MHDEPIQATPLSGGPQFREALDRLEQIVVDGLRHGHFRVFDRVRDREWGKRRELVIRPASRTSSQSPRTNCRANAAPIAAIPAMGTPKMQIT